MHHALKLVCMNLNSIEERFFSNSVKFYRIIMEYLPQKKKKNASLKYRPLIYFPRK